MDWYSKISGLGGDLLGQLRPADASSGQFAMNTAHTDLPRLEPDSEAVPHVPFALVGLTQGGLDTSPLRRGNLERVYTAFDVSQPVANADDLRGRDVEVSALLSGVLYRQTHGIVVGPRGSGKTSLVRVFGQYADREGIVVLYSACDDETSFGEMMRSYLDQIPASSLDPDDVETFRQRVKSFGADSTPHHATAILAMLKYSRLIIILDEYDRITDPDLQGQISSLLKLISDARIPARFVLVGGEAAFVDIVRGHVSLMRHVTRVSTYPLRSDAVYELLDRCADQCELEFTDSAKRLIDAMACGSPYHTRLFGMHAALAAHHDSSAEIDVRHVFDGFERAFDEWSLLNTTAAITFREICDGVHGDPLPLVKLAESLARSGADPDSMPADSVAESSSIKTAASFAVFGSAINEIDGSVTFRDATAPQFLIALYRTRNRNADDKGARNA